MNIILRDNSTSEFEEDEDDYLSENEAVSVFCGNDDYTFNNENNENGYYYGNNEKIYEDDNNSGSE